MTNYDGSLRGLEAEAERNRADLMQTVEALQQRVSPAAIKHDVKDYVREKKDSFLSGLQQSARDNPVQTVAIVAGAAYPLWTLVTRIPVPLLLVGAGLALTRSSSAPTTSAPTTAGAQGAEPNTTRVGSALDAARGGLQNASGVVLDRARSAVGSASQTAESLSQYTGRAAEVASDAASGLRERAYAGAESVRQAANDMASAAGDVLTADRAKHAGAHANEFLDQTIARNPLIAGAVGLAVGAILATALPSTRRENELLGGAGNDVRRRVANAAREGVETVKETATDLYRRAAEQAAQEGLSVSDAKDLVGEVSDKVLAVIRTVSGDHEATSDQSSSTTQNTSGSAGQAGGQL